MYQILPYPLHLRFSDSIFTFSLSTLAVAVIQHSTPLLSCSWLPLSVVIYNNLEHITTQLSFFVSSQTNTSLSRCDFSWQSAQPQPYSCTYITTFTYNSNRRLRPTDHHINNSSSYSWICVTNSPLSPSSSLLTLDLHFHSVYAQLSYTLNLGCGFERVSRNRSSPFCISV